MTIYRYLKNCNSLQLSRGKKSPFYLQKKLLLSPIPLLKSLTEKWLIVQSRYKIVNYQGTYILYLRETNTTPANRVLAKHDMFDVLTQIDKNEKIFKRILGRYHGVSEKVCGLLLQL